MKFRLLLQVLVVLFMFNSSVIADDGYRLWLRYDKIEDASILKSYSKQISSVYLDGNSFILEKAKEELVTGLSGLLSKEIKKDQLGKRKSIVIGVIGSSGIIDNAISENDKSKVTDEGYVITVKDRNIYIGGHDDKGAMYGAFHLLRHIQMNLPLEGLHIIENPKVQLRLLNHWDNLDRTVERGYAGFSIWNWHQLPDYIDPRYTDYARANASIGINGAVVTNVNAKAIVFREDYIQKAAALAEVFRPYGIKIYLTARFSAPIELGKMDTADPLDPDVQQWWKDKAAEIYRHIPDFGGFVVKANSEGQPGPREYDRSHADGANMLADAVAPFGGIVMWRAFVYSNEEPVDRAKQAYNEFMPLDGTFRKNVLIQVKNGPIDFQPREPIHPLFGAMEETPIMMEFQITKEYLGQGTHLVGLANMYEEILQTDTHIKGAGSTVASVIDGSMHNNALTGMAGVSNIGTARNWTSNLFGQADWYAYGRLAWDPYTSAETIFKEWSLMTFPKKTAVQNTVFNLLNKSYEICVQYMTPLGLHHIMGPSHHYGPGPWVKNMSRADWTSVYYHKADSIGLGFDRTASGSDAISQYHPGFAAKISDMDVCPDEFLLWFHHVPWDHTMKSGLTLWEQLCREYHEGATKVGLMKREWIAIKGQVDEERYQQVLMHLTIQEKDAKWWRDACLSYFQSFSKRDIPADLEQPKHRLEYYESLVFPYSPGINPRW